MNRSTVWKPSWSTRLTDRAVRAPVSAGRVSRRPPRRVSVMSPASWRPSRAASSCDLVLLLLTLLLATLLLVLELAASSASAASAAAAALSSSGMVCRAGSGASRRRVGERRDLTAGEATDCDDWLTLLDCWLLIPPPPSPAAAAAASGRVSSVGTGRYALTAPSRPGNLQQHPAPRRWH